MRMSLSSPPTAFAHFRDQQSTVTTSWTTSEPSVASEAGYSGRQSVKSEIFDSASPVVGAVPLCLRIDTHMQCLHNFHITGFSAEGSAR